MNRFYKQTVLIFFIVIVDQLTKGYFQSNYQLGQSTTLIDNFFHLTYVQNRGAAFGFAASFSNWLRVAILRIFPVMIVLGLIGITFKDRNNDEKQLTTWAYAMIIGGAIGNLIDRFSLDYVVDFLDFQFGTYHYPAFNVADSCITTAVILLFVDMILEQKRQKIETNIIENSGD